MSILRFFKPCSTLPTPQNTGLGERATESVNTAVLSAMETCSSSKKRMSVLLSVGVLLSGGMLPKTVMSQL